ncbi:MAG: flagellar motor switch protein FliN [Acidobacteria bacterium]|nr:flagellar motor switch protein FliN [Acidobacteriota bacterium]
MGTDTETGKTERWLLNECASRVVQVLEAMTAQSCRAERRPGAEPEAGALAWWRQPLSLGPDSEIWVGAGESDWTAIGRRSLEAAGIEEAQTGDLHSTYHEILTQALSAVAKAIGARLGCEVVCRPGQESQLPPPEGALLPVAVFLGEDPPIELNFVFSPGLLDGVAAPVTAPAGEAGPVPRPSRTLDLLLEVELPVSVSFGRAQLPLKDVLKLTTGSIVELSRSVSEPVEVIVNNCVVARGEVVVVEGNYGVRIQQVIPRQERLRNLN